MKKKVLSTLLAAALITSALPVMQAGAFGGTYPQSVGYGGMGESINEADTKSAQSSNPANLFTVGGKTFILLDTDDEGNYFVMTEDLYGNHWFDTSYSSYAAQPVIKTVTTGADGNVFTDGDAYKVDDEEWKFNTEDSTNIGYWLNNEFWENGNGTGNILPQEIKDNVIEQEWQVEGMKAIVGWTANDWFDKKYNVDYSKTFAASRSLEPYTVTGKLSLMSYTEYKQYKHIISLKHNMDEWRGFMFRTPHAVVNGISGGTGIKYAYSCGMAKNKGTSNMITCVNDSPISNNMFVRPVMFLSKDFFGKVKVDLASAGQIPRDEIKKNSFDDLMKLYDIDEIKELYSDITNAPEAEGIEILGTPTVDSVLYANYDFVSVGADEKDSEICWLSADSANGKFSLTGFTGNKLYLNEDLKGKVIKYYIRPKDANGKLGKMYISDTVSAVAEGKTVSVKDMDLSGNTLSVTLSNPTEDTITARLISTVYDENNQLISVNAKSVELAAGQETDAQIDMNNAEKGQKVSAMVWSDNNQPILHIER